MFLRAITRLGRAEWGSGPREGEGHGGCYDNFIMVFEKYVRQRTVAH